MKIITTKIVFILLFSALFISGCGQSSIIVNQKYSGKDLTSKTIFIMPISEEAVKINNRDDVADDFEKDKREPELVIKDTV
jgi:hypothetical protein